MMKRRLLHLLPLSLFACVSNEPGSSTPTTTGSESSTTNSESSGSESPDTDTDSSGDEPSISCEGYDEADYPEQPVSFEVDGTRAIMSGYVTSTTPALLSTLLEDHPDLELIVMPFVPGSEDDEANLQAGRMLYDAGLITCVPSKGLIASGGVDFFLAGSRRIAGSGAQIGVHSWASGDGIEGGDLPMDHPDHQLFLEYYADIAIDPAFYWFTLEAAPASGIHWMSADELALYGMLTD